MMMKRFASMPLICALMLLTLSFLFVGNEPCLFVYGLGDPDSYGNVIVWHTVEQWNGSSWIILLNHTTSSNWTVRVAHETPTRFQVKWRLNNTLASSETEAVDYTWIYMNISTIWTNQNLTNTSHSSDANYYYGVELATWNQSGYPASGVTYDVSTKYKAYY